MSFPRGGQDAATGKRSATSTATSETLFGRRPVAPSVEAEERPAKRSKTTKSDKAGFSQPRTAIKKNNEPKEEKAVATSFKSLVDGVRLLGIVRHVGTEELSISLPNRLVGVVSRAECSDLFHSRLDSGKGKDAETSVALSDLFHVGQFVPCSVLSTGKQSGQKNVQLSLRLSRVQGDLTASEIVSGLTLFGCVSSIEDHGAVVSTGIRNLNAFIQSKELSDAKVGQVLFAKVETMNSYTRTATLSVSREATEKAVTRGDKFKIDTLSPGMLLNVRVEEVLANGLKVNFLSYFQATVEQGHMSFPATHDWSGRVKKGMKGRARVISIDLIKKEIALSMAPHIVHLEVTQPKLQVGDIVDQAKVERLDPNIGMLVSLRSAVPTQDEEMEGENINWDQFIPGFVHISNVDDKHVDKIEKKFTIGQDVRARVIGFSPFDNLLAVSCKPSTLEKTVLRTNDLQAGQKVSGKILASESFGMLLEISDSVKGLVPTAHLPPAVKLHKEKKSKKKAGKYDVGSQVDARVLKIEDSGKIVLTMKKQLMESELPVLRKYEDAHMGLVTTGTITKIAEYGVLVTFYDGVFGLVPAAVLHAAGVDRIEDAYTLHQVVKARVTKCDAVKKRLVLSFDVTASTSTSKNAINPELIGTMLEADTVTVTDVENTRFRLQTADGLEAVLPFVHVTDFPRQTALVESIIETVHAGDKIPSPLLVLSQAQDGLLTLTRKPLLLAHVEDETFRVPSSTRDVTKGQLLVGFVASINATKGVFVKFLNDTAALCPKAYLSDSFVTEVDNGRFEVGETVLCRVEKIENDRMVVGFHNFQTGVNGSALPHFTTAMLEQYAVESPWSIGSTETAEFVGVRPYGAVFTMSKGDEQATVLVADAPDSDSWEEGLEKELTLVDYDLDRQVYFASLDTSLVSKKKSKTRLKKDSSVSNATVVAINSTQKLATVVFQRSSKKPENRLAIVGAADLWRPADSTETLELEVGAEIPACRVLDPSMNIPNSPFNALPLLTVDRETSKNAKKARGSAALQEDWEQLPEYSSDDLSVGKLVEGRILSIMESFMDVKLKTDDSCGTVNSRVSIVDADPVPGKSHPFDAYSANSRVKARILAIQQKGVKEQLPVSESNPPRYQFIALSIKKEEVAKEKISAKKLVRPDWAEGSAGRKLLQPGKRVSGVVVEHATGGFLVRLSHCVTGFLSALEVAEEYEQIVKHKEDFPIGTRVEASVVHVDDDRKSVELSLVRSSELQVEVGQTVVGRIAKKRTPVAAPSVMVQLAADVYARVCITELRTPSKWSNEMLAEVQDGAFVRAVIVAKASGNQIDASLREDALADPEAYVAAQQEKQAPKAGDLVPAVVVSTSASGCFLRLNRVLSGRVMLRELSDDFVHNPESEFAPGKIVAGRVVKATDKGVELSLKASVVSQDANALKLQDLKVGMTVKGHITSIKPYGVFVKIDKTALSGLAHISEISDEKVDDLETLFSAGDYVKAKVIKIEGRKLGFGLKPSYFEGEDSSDEESEDEDMEEEASDEEAEEEASEEEVEEEDVPMAAKSEAMELGNDSDSDEDTSGEENSTKNAQFTWDGFANVLDEQDDSESSDEEEEEEVSAPASKKKNDEWVILREKAIAKGEDVPETSADYERRLAVSPHSSFLWIQYMAFHVSLTETDLARDVAKRATSTVSFREEREKLNVWLAYLNLEHDFGDDESFRRVFNDALRVNNPKHVYLHLVDLYDRSNELEDAMNTTKTMQKKFRKSKQTWKRTIQLQVKHEQKDEAALTLQRSLKSLPKHKHLPVILAYGQLLYENDDVEKARTVFEGIVSTYPKRLDLWNVYLDKEIKFADDTGSVRSLFERLLAMEFAPKKMKSLFKKYLAFEHKHGDEQSVAHVKQLAQEFVEQATA